MSVKVEDDFVVLESNIWIDEIINLLNKELIPVLCSSHSFYFMVHIMILFIRCII